MKIITVPVKFYTTTPEDLEKYESLGLPIPEDSREGFLRVNIDAITAWNESSDGDVTLHLNNSSDAWRIYMPIEEFEKLLND